MRDVGVGEGRAETRHRFDIAQRTDQRRIVEVVHGEHIVDEGWKAGALSKQVEDAKLACHPRIFQLKRRIEIDHAVVPPQLAAIDHDGLGCGEKCLGGRADLEDRARVDGRAPGLAAHAEAPGVDELVARHDAHGEARHVEGLHPAGRVGLDLRDQRLDAILHRRLGLGRFRCCRDIREVDGGERDDCQERKEDHQNTVVDFRPEYLRCTLRRNS